MATPKGIPLVLAHRGASAVRPENTIEAFAEARRLGADGVELDVRRTADGALVVAHDATVAGCTIAASTVAELPSWVPLLDQALDACDGMLVNVEIKNLPQDPGWDPEEAIAAEVATVVAPLGERVVVSAFTLATIDAVKRTEPSVPTAWLTLPRFDHARAAEQAAARGHDGLHPEHTAVDADVVAAARAAGLALRTWTADEPAELARLRDLGVDAVITNVPDVARTVYGP